MSERLSPVEFIGAPAIVESRRMLDLFERVRKIAATNAAVLITGETGAGKELVARAIHQFSPRRSKPWVDINCTSIPDHLIESELFGHEKGAFSGADQLKPGFFELADGGTLFLDEAGELETRTQAKLLRVLDGAPYYRLGGLRKVSVNVRIVAATNRDLEREAAAGRFRADLFHRLSEVQIAVPPLRERPEDAIALARYFLGQYAGKLSLAADAIDYITAYHWPGNVRELRNAVANAALRAHGAKVRAWDLQGRAASRPDANLNLRAMELKMIRQALSVTRGHHEKAAAMLGISARTLCRKLKRGDAEGGGSRSARRGGEAGESGEMEAIVGRREGATTAGATG